ncbi:MAG: hypothetical protein JHD35_16430 [Sphingopyxis sp.]|nr:hypothetical protein [Sphingopyxis sp.]
MIDQEVLRKLVPNRFPEDEYPGELFSKRPFEGPERWIGAWSAYLRWQLRAQANEAYFGKRIDRSGFIATGIFRVTRPDEVAVDSNFPIVEGFQFGALFLRGAPDPEVYRSAIPLEGGRLKAPVREAVASIYLHDRSDSDGCIAAVYNDDAGVPCGITARHVVQRYRRGDRVPLHCSDCGYQARMLRTAPGLIDAASVTLPCGGPHYRCPPPGQLRSAVEGETIHLHLGQSGTTACIVMASVSTPSQIRSAAIPQHFLTEKHGYPGDSGSLVSSPDAPHLPADLIGIYLGDNVCEDPDGVLATYGFALDIKQAADILGARDVQGVFHD